MSTPTNPQNPQTKKNPRQKAKFSGSAKPFKCSACGIESQLDANQRQIHKRNCTNQTIECWFPAPGVKNPDTFNLFFVHQRVGTMFSCLRCKKQFQQDNAIQKHTKTCTFGGPAVDDPVSIAWTRLSKHKDRFMDADAEGSSANFTADSPPPSPRLQPQDALEGADNGACGLPRQAPQAASADQVDNQNCPPVSPSSPTTSSYHVPQHRSSHPTPLQDISLNYTSQANTTQTLHGQCHAQSHLAAPIQIDSPQPQLLVHQRLSVQPSPAMRPDAFSSTKKPTLGAIDLPDVFLSTEKSASQVINLAEKVPKSTTIDLADIYGPANRPRGQVIRIGEREQGEVIRIGEREQGEVIKIGKVFPSARTPSASAGPLQSRRTVTRTTTRFPSSRESHIGPIRSPSYQTQPTASASPKTAHSSPTRPSAQNRGFITPRRRPLPNNNSHETPGFQIPNMSNNIDNPQPSPIVPSRLVTPSSHSFTRQSGSVESPLPLARYAEARPLTMNSLASPADILIPDTPLFNPARRIEFPCPSPPLPSSQHRPATSQGSPHGHRFMPYKRPLGTTEDGLFLFESHGGGRFAVQSPAPGPSRVLVKTPSAAPSATKNRPQSNLEAGSSHPPSKLPSSYPQTAQSPTLPFLSPNYRQPPPSPISNAQSNLIPIPMLDRQLVETLQSVLMALREKCPLCYYQGLPHGHEFDKCPLNAVSKLGNRHDPKFESWKGEVFCAVKDTHCWSCFLPTLPVIQIPNKRPVKFHKGRRGHGRPGIEGCQYVDTITPMSYLAWRAGNMPYLLERYQGLHYHTITESLQSFSDWIIGYDEDEIPPPLLILHSIYLMRGHP